MSGKYESSNIIVLEGLEAVRLRPGMYIGTTGIKGLHHILWEIVDNSMDEVANGFGNLIEITLEKDGSVTVEDNGRGIPVDIHPTQKKSGVEVVFTQLHAGGKFNNDNYSYSGGLHGVGASVVNALSDWLEVRVHKNGKIHEMKFSRGHVTQEMKIVGDTDITGTHVRFHPDPEMFDETVYN